MFCDVKLAIPCLVPGTAATFLPIGALLDVTTGLEMVTLLFTELLNTNEPTARMELLQT